MNDAGHVTTGAWLSMTITLNVHTAWLPAASAATNCTFVVPTGNADPSTYPDGLVMYTADTTPTLSVYVMVGQETTAVLFPASVFAVKLETDGHTTTGSVVSATTPCFVTTTVNEHDPTLPAASTAEYVIVVRPSGNVYQFDTILIGTPFRCSVVLTTPTLSAGVASAAIVTVAFVAVDVDGMSSA